MASWWIRFLFAIMVWRYLWKHDRIRYGPAVWGMIFPIGMYTTSTLLFDRAMGCNFLDPVPQVLVYIALAAWILAFAGLLRRLWISLVETSNCSASPSGVARTRWKTSTRSGSVRNALPHDRYRPMLEQQVRYIPQR